MFCVSQCHMIPFHIRVQKNKGRTIILSDPYFFEL